MPFHQARQRHFSLRHCLSLALVLLPFFIFAQKPDKEQKRFDRQARHVPLFFPRNPAKITRHLIKNCSTDQERVRAIYTWITKNIRYDKKAFLSFQYPPGDPKRTLRRRKALCYGYARLFNTLCEQAGVEAYQLIGHAKGATYRRGQRFFRGKHSWSAVNVDGQWQLMDLTWGSGIFVRRKQWFRRLLYKWFDLPYLPKFRLKRKVNYDWYNPHPKVMAATHLPVDPKWQLRDSAIVIREFEAPEPMILPRQDNPYTAEIKAIRHSIPPEQSFAEGNNGYDFNAKDGFDIAMGRIRKAGTYFSVQALVEASIGQWERGVELFEGSTPYLVAYMDTVKVAHRARLKEIARFFAQGRRGHGMARRDILRAIRKEKAMPDKESRFQKQQRYEGIKTNRAWSKIKRDQFRKRSSKVKLTERQRVRLQAGFTRSLAQFEAQGDSMEAIEQRLLKRAAVLDSLEKRLEFHRRRAFNQVDANTRMLMHAMEWELWDGWAAVIRVEDSIEVAERKWRMEDRAFYAAHQRGRTAMARMQQYAQVAKVDVARMYKAGFPVAACEARLDTIVEMFSSAEAKRDTFWTHIDERIKQEGSYAVVSEDFARKTAKKIRRQARLLAKYVGIETDHENADFANEVRLTGELRGKARLGAGELRRRIARTKRELEKAAVTR